MDDIRFTAGTPEDGPLVHRIFHLSIMDFSRRTGQSDQTPQQDEEGVAAGWEKWRPLFDHLASTAEHYLIAWQGEEAIGYARSIIRDGVRELTDFFVLPGRQSAGLGGALLRRVFPVEGARHRSIIATTDPRALVRYMKAGVYARFPIFNFSRAPRQDAQFAGSGLRFIPISAGAQDQDTLAQVDRAMLGYTRQVDHAYWQTERQGFLVYREGGLAGYGYAGYDSGPVALFNPADFSAVLAHAEALTAKVSDKIHFEVPLVNRFAVDWLLSSGYEMNAFITLLMSDQPIGRMEHYLLPAPPFIL